MTIAWNDSHRTGHPEIDDQHRTLFACVSFFLGATDKRAFMQGALQLRQYAREHFAYEENLMHALKYPDRDRHASQHKALLSEIDTIINTIARETHNRTDLVSFLTAWLTAHIGEADARLVAFAASQQASKT